MSWGIALVGMAAAFAVGMLLGSAVAIWNVAGIMWRMSDEGRAVMRGDKPALSVNERWLLKDIGDWLYRGMRAPRPRRRAF